MATGPHTRRQQCSPQTVHQLGHPHGGPTEPQVDLVERSREDQGRGRSREHLDWDGATCWLAGRSHIRLPKDLKPCSPAAPHLRPLTQHHPGNLPYPPRPAGTSGTTLCLAEVSSSLCSCC